MKSALFDCFSGASGDMILAALIDCGLPVKALSKALQGFPLKGIALKVKKDSRQGIGGTRLKVAVSIRSGKTHTRNLGSIVGMIRASSLSKTVQENASAIFEKIGQVESRIHRISIQDVHFHEIGAADSIVDIVGACFGLDYLGVEKVLFTPPAMGSGWVQTAHGKFPIPSPAAVQLLKGFPVRWGEPCPGEWTTPTAAAILAHFGQCKQEMPVLICERVGYGIGHANPSTHPNVLRLVLGSLPSAKAMQDFVWSVQSNIDDMQPQWVGPVMEKLFQAGALDVFITPIQMKKNRPAIMLEALCDDAHRQAICDALLRQTTTFGVRLHRLQRQILPRETRTVQTPWGPVRFKVALMDGKVLKSMPEFEDCLALSKKKDIPLGTIYQALASRSL